jgi:hypothetical protein
MRQPGNEGSQENYYEKGRNAGRLFSAIKNGDVFCPA